VELKLTELPKPAGTGDPFTNLQDGLRLAGELLRRHPSNQPAHHRHHRWQPTAYFSRGRLYCEWPLAFGGSACGRRRTLKEVERVPVRGSPSTPSCSTTAPSLRGLRRTHEPASTRDARFTPVPITWASTCSWITSAGSAKRVVKRGGAPPGSRHPPAPNAAREPGRRRSRVPPASSGAIRRRSRSARRDVLAHSSITLAMAAASNGSPRTCGWPRARPARHARTRAGRPRS